MFRLLTSNQRLGWDRWRTETVCRGEHGQEGAAAGGHAPEGQEI
jgi:hypothetical protein